MVSYFKEPVNPLFQLQFKHYEIKKNRRFGVRALVKGGRDITMVTTHANFVVLFSTVVV